MTAAIETVALEKHYGRHFAVRGIDLRVEQGSIFGLIGPNGAGKTTVLRMLLDIIRPTGGELRVLGRAPREAGAALRRRIGYLPGELKLDDRVNGRALLERLTALSGPVAPGSIDLLAERLDIDLSRPVHTLSKGNRQKLGLVQALMHRPELLVLDEPTSGLDPLVQREFITLVREARNAGQTVLLSSHVLSEIQHTADEVAVLATGTIVARGDVASLRLTSVSRVRAVLSAGSAAEVRIALGRVPRLDELDVSAAPGNLVRLTCTLRGTVDPLVQALARFTVRDLTIEEPDLEESVLELYGRTTALT
ncbi:ABC transporter ATP-binding protein [Leucobacter luti]|uniref:ABC transporter ATP-binding protein n=1 Tax=Leucobacter luti TaxID=340320 RepID=UPI00105128E7|nr:ABC transporter ATP-binding protein [Leucobacter luti]MCW2288317.1 ABC-2 type transport system ATP-binding protein [Leucobacter luti]QYM75735.1 ABC transporter ATP-binding protein [Leucobacter luti]TCK45526.1 ABC-2 type transport system ATP-binding protein [Leucobacter luti]